MPCGGTHARGHSRRVVITGMGCITPIGSSVKETWENLLKGKSGVSRITSFDASDLPVKIAAEVKGFTPRLVDEKELHRYDRFELLTLSATFEALEDAGFISNSKVCISYSSDRVGVIIGSGIGGIKTIEDSMRISIEKSPKKISPFAIPASIINMAAGLVSIKTGAQGCALAPATSCAAGLHSIIEGYSYIKLNMFDMVIAGGTEAAITPLVIAGFASMRALSTRNDEPHRASRPFDRGRDGFVIGEGSGIVILEEYESAKKRGAKIYAEIVGCGLSSDAYHITAPLQSGAGYALAMRRALEEAGFPKIDYINAHGTSTKHNDEVETRAIKIVFGEGAKSIAVSSTKSMIGHLIGAAGAVETIFTALSIYNNVVPPTINLEEPDPECDLDYVPWTPREMKVHYAMNNSFGFGGTNASIVLRKI